MLTNPHAKTNLILHLGPKTDSRRFAINFVMQEISLSDDLVVKQNNSGEIIIRCSDPAVPTGEDNLCYKAVRIMQDVSGRNDGVSIALLKNIPTAGGLGGGSADAAHVVKALNNLWKLGMTDDELIRAINPELGTDASFFIKGGTARVTNNGLEIQKIEANLDLTYVFVLPEIKVPSNKTESVYKYFDPEKVTEKPDVEGMIDALNNGDVKGVADRLFNSFEYSLPPHYESVPKIKEELKAAGCLGAAMCGAGPTAFGICESVESAEQISATFGTRSEVLRTFCASYRMSRGGSDE